MCVLFKNLIVVLFFYGGTLHLDEFVLGENPLTNFHSSEKVLPGPTCCKEKGYVEGKHGIDGAN